MLHHYQFSNLRLKHGPLITALVNSERLFLKILVLKKSVQIFNVTHNSYPQYLTISSQKIKCSDQGVIIVDNCDNSLFGLTATASEEIFNVFFCCCGCLLCAACCRQNSSCLFITVDLFTIIKLKIV